MTAKRVDWCRHFTGIPMLAFLRAGITPSTRHQPPLVKIATRATHQAAEKAAAYSFFARMQELNESKVSARLLARSVALMVFCPRVIARDLFRGIALHAAPKRWCHHLPRLYIMRSSIYVRNRVRQIDLPWGQPTEQCTPEPYFAPETTPRLGGGSHCTPVPLARTIRHGFPSSNQTCSKENVDGSVRVRRCTLRSSPARGIVGRRVHHIYWPMLSVDGHPVLGRSQSMPLN